MGLTRRPPKPGGVYYLYFYDSHGKRIRKSLDTTVLREAKERRDAILAGNADLRWGKRDLDVKPDAFWKCDEDPAKDTGAYIAWARRHKAVESIKRERIDWMNFITFVKPAALGAVTPRDVEKWKVHLLDVQKQSPRTINDACVRIGALYNHAARLELYGRGNPFKGIRKLPTTQKPVRFLDEAQRLKVLELAERYSPGLHLFVALCLYAGLRANEAANATWAWVDWAGNTLTVTAGGRFTTKNRKSRVVPMHKDLRAVMEKYGPLEPGEYIVNPEKEPGVWRIRVEFKKALKMVTAAAGVPWCTAHTLRHSFASGLVSKGVSIFKVSQWLGHSDVRVSQIYAHLAPQDADIDKL